VPNSELASERLVLLSDRVCRLCGRYADELRELLAE
jgi:hypothetical protein